MKHCPEEERKTDDEEYLKKLRTMKPSEFVEEVYGIKLLPHQKFIVDNVANYPGRIYIMYPRGRMMYDEQN